MKVSVLIPRSFCPTLLSQMFAALSCFFLHCEASGSVLHFLVVSTIEDRSENFTDSPSESEYLIPRSPLCQLVHSTCAKSLFDEGKGTRRFPTWTQPREKFSHLHRGTRDPSFVVGPSRPVKTMFVFVVEQTLLTLSNSELNSSVLFEIPRQVHLWMTKPRYITGTSMSDGRTTHQRNVDSHRFFFLKGERLMLMIWMNGAPKNSGPKKAQRSLDRKT